MAKKINVYDGANWLTLPGSSGEYTEEAATTDDTVFGATFSSNESTLITWSINANAYFKGFAGYKAKLLKFSASAANTGVAMTQESGQIYTLGTGQAFDRNFPITVYDGATDVTAQVEWIDYLFGRIKFVDTYTVTGAVTVDAYIISFTTIGTASSFTLTQNADAIQTTDFATAQGNNGFHTYNPGLRTVSLDLTGFYTISNDFSNILQGRQEILIEVNPDGNSKSVARGYFKAASHGQSGDVGALEEETITFNLNVPDDQKLYLPFSWQHATDTTLSPAVKVVLDNWLSETKTNVQYLYNGVNGYQGTSVITDVSLESSLEGMNTFSVSFQGDGAPTAI